jgi:hypothetical protein
LFNHPEPGKITGLGPAPYIARPIRRFERGAMLMDRKKKLRVAALPVAVAAIVAPFAIQGCNDSGFDNPLDSVCCSDFKPGTNMIDVDWGLDASANLEFGAAMQAIGDFSATAQGMVNDLGVACKGLAVDLGVDENSISEKDPNEFTKKWCASAAKALTDLKAKVQITLSVQPARCEVNVSAKLDCQAQCSAQAMCQLTPAQIEASCEPGKLSGQCSGKCTGSCEGSANLAVSCNGKCDGTCEGTCMGGTSTGGACDGTCNGKCRGSCAVDGGAMASCEGTCSGTCDVDFEAPKCSGKFTPPMGMCEASASCEGSCDASATAKAECTPPAVDVEVSTAGFDREIAALQKWLPTIFLNIQGRLETLQGELSAITDVAANFQSDLSGSATAVFCIVPASDALVTAGANITATAAAGVSITGAIGGT